MYIIVRRKEANTVENKPTPTKRLLAEVPDDMLREVKKALIDLGMSMKDCLPVITNYYLRLNLTIEQMGVSQEAYDGVMKQIKTLEGGE